MKRQAGDTVTIKKDLKENKIYGTGVVVEEMMAFRGHTVTIAEEVDDIDYKIIEDGQTWYWTDEMFDIIPLSSKHVNMEKRLLRRIMVDLITNK